MRANRSSGSGCAGLPVPREQRQRLALPGEVLHELARQFDRVPFHAADAGDAGKIDFGQQMMQAVAEFVEQRGHVVVRQQRRLLRRRRREVAGQIGDRQMRRRAVAKARAAHVHPGAAALAGARIQIDIGAGDDLAVGIEHVVEAHVRMPDIDAVAQRAGARRTRAR